MARVVTWDEFFEHCRPLDCWVLVDGGVYNVSDYLVEHPGGDDILLAFSGADASVKFNSVPHSDYALSLRNARRVGTIESNPPTADYLERLKQRRQHRMREKLQVRRQPIEQGEVASHQSEQSCWVQLEGSVYDLTSYLHEHPGGLSKIMSVAGKDGTAAFKEVNHSIDALSKRQEFYIGPAAVRGNHFSLLLVMLLCGLAAGWLATRCL